MTGISPEDLKVLTQCLRAAIEGPFFKGILFSEREFPSVVGSNWKQLDCILQFWPDLDSVELHRQYEALETRVFDTRLRLADGSPWPHRSTETEIRGGVGSCFYWLLGGIDPPEGARSENAQKAWDEYISVSPQVAHDAYKRWNALQQKK